MKKVFTDRAWDEYLYWQKHDKRMLKKVNELIKDIERNHPHGIGKPEALKHTLSGFWSRRINEEHRLVYRVLEDQIQIVQMRYHY